MTHIFSRSSIASFCSGMTAWAFLCVQAAAQQPVFNGGGIEEGLDQADEVTGISTEDPREAVINILEAVLNFAALIATIMVIVAGFYLVLSLGNDDQKEKAKKIVYYTLIGLIVLLFARVIVSIVTEWLPSQV